ncbi:hypothetical protein [Streptomyces achromogenes]|uniref:hypothetical protein n=1 Tax=Streptomyces achromogenes TaxID=67255 RepID=UPI003A80D2D0
MTDDWRTDRIRAALSGENPTVLRRLTAGFAVIGDVQFLPGYSVLLVDEPEVQRLSDLPRAKRLSFLSDMDQLGEAVERACRRLDPAFRRVNLEILGNDQRRTGPAALGDLSVLGPVGVRAAAPVIGDGRPNLHPAPPCRPPFPR